MIANILLFLMIFIIGEIFLTFTWFKYLKKYFPITESEEAKENKPFFLLDISVFKGILERLILLIGLVFGIDQVLIVFGAIKIGTRFDKNQKILNDYFIIGNFSSILIVFGYLKLYETLIQLIPFNFCELL